MAATWRRNTAMFAKNSNIDLKPVDCGSQRNISVCTLLSCKLLHWESSSFFFFLFFLYSPHVSPLHWAAGFKKVYKQPFSFHSPSFSATIIQMEA